MRYLNLCIVVFFSAFPILVSGQKEKSYIRQGTSEYGEKKYGNAEVSYQKATGLNPESFEAKFNLGNALFKQEKYDDAISKYSDLTHNQSDKQKLASVYYNLGNSHLHKTSKLLNDQKLEDAIKEVDKSISAYKSSLRNHPSDREAKYNLNYAMQVKKMLEEEKKRQENKDKKNQDQDKQENNQQEDQNKNQNDKDKGDQDKENKDQDGESDSQQENKEGKPQQETLSKEDAMRLLNAIENDEKKVQEKLKKIKGTRIKKQEKDW